MAEFYGFVFQILIKSKNLDFVGKNTSSINTFVAQEKRLLTAMVDTMYPGFSRGSICAQRRTNAARYQGMPARRKPIMNLQKDEIKLKQTAKNHRK